jgi:hypothetical protein
VAEITNVYDNDERGLLFNNVCFRRPSVYSFWTAPCDIGCLSRENESPNRPGTSRLRMTRFTFCTYQFVLGI